MPSEHLRTEDFTILVQPLLDHIQKPEAVAQNGNTQSSIRMSDVIDNLGQQYVDIVQEGGGVHGIALAGYTYILEKLDVSFTKMAGTSAGSINTLLLSAVTTKRELHVLKENATNRESTAKPEETYRPEELKDENYYSTRSEKLLSYLAALNLSDFVDGHPTWRKLLLSLFSGKVNFELALQYRTKLITRLTLFVIAVAAVFVLSFLFSLLYKENAAGTLSTALKGCLLASFLLFCYLTAQIIYLYGLYSKIEGLGINPGDKFLNWADGILKNNGITNTAVLKNKLQQEYEAFKPRYKPPVYDTAYDNDLFATQQHLYDELKQSIDRLELSSTRSLAEEIDLLILRLNYIAKGICNDNTLEQARAKALLALYTRVLVLKQTIPPNDEYEKKTSLDKEIAIVSTDLTNEIKVEFPAMHRLYWGDNFSISPACYIRASMAVPAFFRPYRINYDLKQKEAQEAEWKSLMNTHKKIDTVPYALLVDGGLLSNFPVNIFYSTETPLPFKPTVGVKLEFEDESESNDIKNDPKKFVGAAISSLRFFYDRDFLMKHKVFNRTVRCIDTGDIHWLNFNLTEKEKIELFVRGVLTACVFIESRKYTTDDCRRKLAINELLTIADKLEFQGKTIRKFSTAFKTEDLNPDVWFNWEDYKIQRILSLGNSTEIKENLKRKASFKSSISHR